MFQSLQDRIWDDLVFSMNSLCKRSYHISGELLESIGHHDLIVGKPTRTKVASSFDHLTTELRQTFGLLACVYKLRVSGDIDSVADSPKDSTGAIIRSLTDLIVRPALISAISESNE